MIGWSLRKLAQVMVLGRSYAFPCFLHWNMACSKPVCPLAAFHLPFRHQYSTVTHQLAWPLFFMMLQLLSAQVC